MPLIYLECPFNLAEFNKNKTEFTLASKTDAGKNSGAYLAFILYNADIPTHCMNDFLFLENFRKKFSKVIATGFL